jgi:hypothetical protein
VGAGLKLDYEAVKDFVDFSTHSDVKAFAGAILTSIVTGLLFNIMVASIIIYTPLLLSLVQFSFFLNAWLLHRHIGWNKTFVEQSTLYLSLAWGLGFQVWTTLGYSFLRSLAGENMDEGHSIPYVMSFGNTQFRMDLNLGLLLLSIPVSLLLIGWLHTRYCRRKGLLP